MDSVINHYYLIIIHYLGFMDYASSSGDKVNLKINTIKSNKTTI